MNRQQRLDHNLETIHIHTRANTAEGTTAQETLIPALESLSRRSQALLEADRFTTRADGYATTTPGNGEPGGSGWSPSSSTETAAMAEPRADGIHQAALACEEHIAKAAVHLAGASAALVRADRIRNPNVDNQPYDWVAQQHKLPHDDAWTVAFNTTFQGYLKPAWPDEHGVSRFTYLFVRDNKRTPTRDEMCQHLQRGVTRLHEKAS